VKTIFSTTAVHPRDRFDYWHSVACKNLVDHASKPEIRQIFRAELQTGVLADVGLVLFENSPMAISHTARHVARATTDELFVCRQVAGALVPEQDGREVLLAPGDCTLLDPQLPYDGEFSAGSKLLVLKVPRRLLEARIGTTRETIACTIKPLEAEGSLMSAFLAMPPAHAGRLGPAAEEIVKDQVLDLVVVSLAKATSGRTPRVSSARSLALLRVRAAIEARLTEPALDASTVAAAAGVSVRYANAVLAEASTSIVRLIQARRLARCRRALADPLQAHRTVSEIAYGCGFSDMTHFGRKFRAAYGLLPSEYRRPANATNF
jgi:AraC family transcriptional regulator, positive regulator of tynA and feaB